MKHTISWWIRLRAAWRIWWYLCPTCNSDAREIETCWLCHGSREFPLSDFTRRIYRQAYELK